MVKEFEESAKILAIEFAILDLHCPFPPASLENGIEFGSVSFTVAGPAVMLLATVLLTTMSHTTFCPCVNVIVRNTAPAADPRNGVGVTLGTCYAQFRGLLPATP
jgi:hypothetical protein